MRHRVFLSRAVLLALLLVGVRGSGFHRRTHTYLDQDQVLEYDAIAGTYSVLQMIRGEQLRSGMCQTFNPSPLRRGVLPSFRKHVYLGDDRLLEIDPATGDFRVLCYNRTEPCADAAVGSAPSEFGRVVQMGTNRDFAEADVVLSVGQDEILILDSARATYKVRMYDRAADLPAPRSFVEAQTFGTEPLGEPEFGQPFPGLPIINGSLSRPVPGSFLYAGHGLLLGYTAGGPHWALFRYDRTAIGEYGKPLRQLRAGLWARNVSASALNSTAQRELTYLGADAVLDYEPGSCGYTVWPLLRPDKLPAQTAPPALDPLAQSLAPLDAGSFCVATCGGTCASSGETGGGSCGWCGAPLGGPASTTGSRGGSGLAGLSTLGSASGACFCSCQTWNWQGKGCPGTQQEQPECPAHRTCSSCLDDPTCAWCGTAEQCYPRHVQSSQMCADWHDLTCPMVPLDKAFSGEPNRPCSPRGAGAGQWDLALLQLPEDCD